MSVLVAGQNYWGHGANLAEAKARWRKQHGGSRKLADGYEVFEFGPGVEFTSIDQMGRVSWKILEPGAVPFRREFPPRARR